MSFLVTGSNLFGQWFSEETVFSSFHDIEVNKNIDIEESAQVKLACINWAYNIYQVDNKFYLCGSWRGNENQIENLDLPEECKNLPGSTLTVVGNDNHLIVINRITHVIWVVSLEEKNNYRKLKLNIDTPIKDDGIKRMRLDDNIAEVVVTNNSYLYLTAGGNLYSGQLPSHLDTSHCFGKVIHIVSGYEHFILLTDAGRVYTWGNSRRLQLGHGDLTNLELPTEVEALSGIKIVKVDAGGWHSLALSESGDLYGWGWNDTGQLGIKSSPEKSHEVLKAEGLKSYPLPTIVDLFDENDDEVNLNIKDIACGSRHSAIILEDNTVWTTGNNKYGQLGYSPDLYPTVDYFKKSYKCLPNYDLNSGPWSTILAKNQ